MRSMSAAPFTLPLMIEKSGTVMIAMMVKAITTSNNEKPDE